MKYLFLIALLCLIISCKTSKTTVNNEQYVRFFNKDAVSPLKEELPELYKL